MPNRDPRERLASPVLCALLIVTGFVGGMAITDGDTPCDMVVAVGACD